MSSYRPANRPWVTAAVAAIVGLCFTIGGIWLLTLHDTAYYLVAGLGLLAVAVLLWRQQEAALWLYGVVYLGTWAWALAEAHFDGWKLEPRLLLPSLFGLWLLTPRVTRSLYMRPSAVRRGLLSAGIVALAVCAWLGMRDPGVFQYRLDLASAAPAAVPASSQPDDTAGWRYYGRTARGERWSPLKQITPQNVTGLQKAWEIHTGDLPKKGENSHGYEFNFEVTPIKVADTLYICTPHSQVMALDAENGTMRWRFDPAPDTSNNAYHACRGVAYYEAPAGTATTCPRRILAPVADARLAALDADSGKLCEDFGEHGYISLTQYIGPVPKGFHFVTSQPLVAKDRMLLGGWIYDGQKTDEPSGAVRAFDPVSGKLAWAWDMGRADHAAHPAPGESLTPATPNAWGTYTADLDLGLAYLPLGGSVPDYYGPQRRPFDDAYSGSVVAVDIETGDERWHFQTTHHDLWDFDVPIGPSLVDLPDGKGGTIPALVQTTKRGELFLLDRRTGTPLADVTEKEVPQDALPGERPAKTQPYSTGMPSLAPERVQAQDVWGATPIDQMVCRIDFDRMHYEGDFTPITEQKTLVYPAFDGVIDWHGAAIDPARGWLIANLSYIPFTATAYRREVAEKKGIIEPWNGQGQPPRPKDFAINPQYGTPFATVVEPWLNFLEVPCKAPPWGQLVAVDLKSRQIVWRRTLGTTRDTGPLNLRFGPPFNTGVFNIGGNVVTASGLVFMGATADNYLRAFDEVSGQELWRARLPAGGQANPMTYLGRDGRQYVVIAAGGHGGLRTKPGDAVIAYALPADGAK